MKAQIKQPVNYPLVIRGLDSIPDKLIAAGARALERGLVYTVGVSQREFLSGPRPQKLDVRTRRLRQSITQKVDPVTKRGVIGRIGSNVIYARRHEFGFQGVESVRAHTRVLAQVGPTGRELATSNKRAARAQRGGLVLVSFVRAHQRKQNYKGRPFLKPALDKSKRVILAEIQKELAGVKP